jgi:hypothetical protein
MKPKLRCTELLGLFWTLSIVWYVETKDHNVSETGSVSVLRWMRQDKPIQLVSLERASLNSSVQHTPSSESFQVYLPFVHYRLVIGKFRPS